MDHEGGSELLGNEADHPRIHEDSGDGCPGERGERGAEILKPGHGSGGEPVVRREQEDLASGALEPAESTTDTQRGHGLPRLFSYGCYALY